MRQTLKRISAPILKSFFKTYLNRATQYRYEDISIVVEKGVFHPKYFFSTRVLLEFLKEKELKEKRLLELGAGSGLISFYCAKQGAQVTASDVSQSAIQGLRNNADKLECPIEIIESDLFEKFMDRQFDYVMINPPYYPEEPKNEAERAWFCGTQFEYFHKLFTQLRKRQKQELVWMILSEDCQIDHIKSIAEEKGVEFEQVAIDKNWAEKNFIFRLKLV